MLFVSRWRVSSFSGVCFSLRRLLSDRPSVLSGWASVNTYRPAMLNGSGSTRKQQWSLKGTETAMFGPQTAACRRA